MKRSIIGFIMMGAMAVASPVKAQNWKVALMNPSSWFVGDISSQPNDVDFEQAKGVEIGGKTGAEIKKYMLKFSKNFNIIDGVMISTIRGGEVLKVSVPSSQLFNANDSVLNANGDFTLIPALELMNKGLTSLIITGHSDNTGSKDYIHMISSRRALSVEKWFLGKDIKESRMSVFSFGDSMPLFDNDSMEKRAKNRRITLYFVPNKNMIKLAKKGKLNK